MLRQENVFKIGRIGKPHGVKGEVVFLFTDDVFDRVDADYLIVEREGLLVPFYIEEYRFRSDESALLKLEGIDTQEQARELTNSDVFFERSKADEDQAPSTAEIIGYTMTDHDTGDAIGTITGIDDSTANTLLEVSRNGGTCLVPVAEEFIRAIDRKKKTIRVTLPEGLLEI